MNTYIRSIEGIAFAIVNYQSDVAKEIDIVT